MRQKCARITQCIGARACALATIRRAVGACVYIQSSGKHIHIHTHAHILSNTQTHASEQVMSANFTCMREYAREVCVRIYSYTFRYNISYISYAYIHVPQAAATALNLHGSLFAYIVYMVRYIVYYVCCLKLIARRLECCALVC